MNPARLFYRTHQFWQALSVKPGEAELEQAARLLSPAQQALFFRLQQAEQAHSLRILRHLMDQGECHPDLLAAALLHDVGKTLFPLKLRERVWIVLAHAFWPGWAKEWGASSGPFDPTWPAWRKALVIASQHARWGADLAAQSGSSPLAVELIRRHQEKLAGAPQNLAELLLQKLQAVDNES